MRKIIVLILVMSIIIAMSVPAFALTPKWEYTPVKVPTIKVDTTAISNAVSSWLKANPIKLPPLKVSIATLG